MNAELTKRMATELAVWLGPGWIMDAPRQDDKVDLFNITLGIRIRIEGTVVSKGVQRCIAELYPVDDNLQHFFPKTNVGFTWEWDNPKLYEKHITRRLLHSVSYIRLTVANAERAYRNNQRKLAAADRVVHHLATYGLRKDNYSTNRVTGSINDLNGRGRWIAVEFEQYPEHKISCDVDLSSLTLTQLKAIVEILTNKNPDNVYDDIRFAPGVIEVTEEFYDEAKGALPPIYANCDSFSMWAMGEPYAGSGDNTTYCWFTCAGDKCIACYGSESEAKVTFEDYFADN